MTQEEILIRLGVDASSLRRGLTSAGHGITEWATEIATKIGGIFAIEQLFERAHGLREYASQLINAAESAGVTVEFLQQLQSVTNRLGLDSQKAGTALEFLAKQIGEARNGSKDVNEKFEKWGISIKGLTTEDVFLKIVERISQIGDAAQRTALRMDLMGKSSRGMGALFAQGQEELRKEMATSLTISEGQLTALHKEAGFWAEIGRFMKQTAVGIYTTFTGRGGTLPEGISEHMVAEKMNELREHGEEHGITDETIPGAVREFAVKALLEERVEAERKSIETQEEDTKAKVDWMNEQGDWRKDFRDSFKREAELLKESARRIKERNDAYKEDTETLKRIQHLSRTLKKDQRARDEQGRLYPTIDELADNWGPFTWAARQLRGLDQDQIASRFYGNTQRAEWDKNRANEIRGWLAQNGIITPDDHLRNIDESMADTQKDLNSLLNLAENEGLNVNPVMGE